MNIIQLEDPAKCVEEVAEELCENMMETHQNQSTYSYVIDEVADKDNFADLLDEMIEDKFVRDDIFTQAVLWADSSVKEAFVRAYKLGYEAAQRKNNECK